LFKKLVAVPVRIVGGVLVKSPKGMILILGICVIIAIIAAETMIMLDTPTENSIFRGICPLH
tara:strand:- start:5278 stop:5463 length:186 start_codon:yes stop_codon:yes gene_type:complete